VGFVLGRLVVVGLALERLRSVLQFVGLCVGISFGLINGRQEGRMSVDVGVGSLGSFVCSLEARRSRAARKMSMEVRSAVLGPVCSRWGV